MPVERVVGTITKPPDRLGEGKRGTRAAHIVVCQEPELLGLLVSVSLGFHTDKAHWLHTRDRHLSRVSLSARSGGIQRSHQSRHPAGIGRGLHGHPWAFDVLLALT
jgi:hypothetical protein